MVDLRVVNVDERLLGLEVPDESDGGRFAGIPRVSLERKSEDSNTLNNHH